MGETKVTRSPDASSGRSPDAFSGLSVLVLAGGSSTRMGQDKIWLELEGRPLVEHVIRRAAPLATELIFSSRTGDLGRFRVWTATLRSSGVLSELLPVQTVADRVAGGGPLAGLHAGLSAATQDLVLTLGADMPFVNVSLLRHLTTLVTGYDAVVPLIPSPNTGQAEWEPLHAVYRQSCLPAIEACLSANRRRTVSFLRDVRTRAVLAEEILPFDPDLLSFRNVNTPEDLERARTILRALGE